ncbi:hypothetical protein BJ138DRAFT_235305 [Hygrophoropsis aurantiaca]|uniref:Uncharacterized protein n=1 Tax=Hygrophoropsis aurantiaca TaxID=72124 RepID=A0ACB8A8J0_9AGAM|nr:hypothetical protein BJ138DRAFT_235305 [Hygrophoropsis aurantiaca]
MVAPKITHPSLVVLASIISGSLVAAQCAYTHPKFGVSLAIYKHTHCAALEPTDHYIFGGKALVDGFEHNECQCLNFPTHFHGEVNSYVFSTGVHERATMELLYEPKCDKVGSHHKYVEENHIEEVVNYGAELLSAWVCIDHEPKHPEDEPYLLDELEKGGGRGVKSIAHKAEKLGKKIAAGAKDVVGALGAVGVAAGTAEGIAGIAGATGTEVLEGLAAVF